MRKVIRNIPTRELLLLLAQANSIGAPFIDITFDNERKSLTIQPISIVESKKRYIDGKEGTDMEDIINES